MTPPPAEGPPYFVVLGTIEPRKNHLLLLNVWRRLAQTLGPEATPRLVLIGRRGWENENILDLLDRCPVLKGVVVEHNRLPDPEVRTLIAGARALLMPSFAEGFGLPVVEALALGAPVIASDLPALRETGGDAPDYLDPLDGPAWARAILDYAAPRSLRRQAQLARLSNWRAPTWEDHVGGVLDFLAETAR
jgi:glycosyltransferase involved in cell wall biosynthesis